MKKIPSQLLKEIRTSGVGYLSVRVSSGILTLTALVLLTSTLGAAEYGRYSYAISVIALIVTFSQLGLPTLILRETAQAFQLTQWAKVGGLTRWSMRVAILIAFASSVSVYFYTLFDTDIEVKDVVDTVSLPIIALLLPPVIVALNNRVAILRGLQRVVVATILQRNVSILFVVIGVLIFLFIFNFAKLSADQILYLELLGFLIALCLAFVYVRFRATELYQQKHNLMYDRKYWISAATPLALIVGLRTLNTNIDILLLGWFVPASEVGIYKIALRVATVTLLGQEFVIMVLSAHFAKLYAKGDIDVLATLTRQAARLSVVIAITTLVGFFFLGSWILGQLFGSEFEAARTYLLIISAGYTCSVGLGAVSTILNMTGHEKRTAKGASIAAVVNVGLNLVLIPPYGATGAATATVISLLVLNFYLWRSVQSLLSFKPGVY